MSDTFYIRQLPDVDKQMIKRGLCPWCCVRLIDGHLLTPKVKGDVCPDCGDKFLAYGEGR